MDLSSWDNMLCSSLPFNLSLRRHILSEQLQLVHLELADLVLQLAQLGALLVRARGVSLRDRHSPTAAGAAHVGEGGELGARHGEPRAAGRSVRYLRAAPPPDDAHVDLGGRRDEAPGAPDAVAADRRGDHEHVGGGRVHGRARATQAALARAQQAARQQSKRRDTAQSPAATHYFWCCLHTLPGKRLAYCVPARVLTVGLLLIKCW